eukprot:2176051-Prymnesium_polylepis.1
MQPSLDELPPERQRAAAHAAAHDHDPTACRVQHVDEDICGANRNNCHRAPEDRESVTTQRIAAARGSQRCRWRFVAFESCISPREPAQRGLGVRQSRVTRGDGEIKHCVC